MACALAVFGAAATTPAFAQDAMTLRGPWLGAGLGTASAQVNCDLCASDRNGGLSGYVAGGLRVAPKGGGYDFRAGPKVWISPFANLIVTNSGNLTSGTTLVTDASFSMLQIGAGVTWR